MLHLLSGTTRLATGLTVARTRCTAYDCEYATLTSPRGRLPRLQLDGDIRLLDEKGGRPSIIPDAALDHERARVPQTQNHPSRSGKTTSLPLLRGGAVCPSWTIVSPVS